MAVEWCESKRFTGQWYTIALSSGDASIWLVPCEDGWYVEDGNLIEYAGSFETLEQAQLAAELMFE